MNDTALPKPPPGGNGRLLPPDAGRDRPLFLVAAILVFLACIAALGARGAWLQAQTWTSDLESSLTIQVRPVDERDTAADAETAAEIARSMDGVRNATARTREHALALLRPWLGEGNLPDDLPLPLMVEVELDSEIVHAGSFQPEALQARLDEAGLAANRRRSFALGRSRAPRRDDSTDAGPGPSRTGCRCGRGRRRLCRTGQPRRPSGRDRRAASMRGPRTGLSPACSSGVSSCWA